MVSGPYQSKLLRLVVSQYRRGIERHRQAVRQTRITMTTGAVIGTTWALVPVHVAVRWSQSWQKRLKRMIAPSSAERLEPFEHETGMDDTDGVDAIAQVLSVLKSSLSPQQAAAVGKKTSLLSRIKQLWRSDDVRVVGIASDLETRKVVLILSDRSVWDGLGDDQCRQIADEIDKRVGYSAVGIVTGHAVAGEANALRLSASCAIAKTESAIDKRVSCGNVRSPNQSFKLAHSVRAFWVEVLRAVVSLRRRKQQRLPEGAKRLPSPSRIWIQLLGHQQGLLLSSVSQQYMPILEGFSPFSHDSLEADVTSSVYVEHPLERLLNGIDQVLLWIERQWQRFTGWIRQF